MNEVMNLVVTVPLWAVAAFLLLGLLLIALDGWRARQWQHLAILAARINTRPAGPGLPDLPGALDAAAQSLSNPPESRHNWRT